MQLWAQGHRDPNSLDSYFVASGVLSVEVASSKPGASRACRTALCGVALLRSRGVIFEDVADPGLTTVNGIADVSGNYPSKVSGERAAWFRDSEGNLLGIGPPVPYKG
jgi:hypothetical protein